MKHVYAFHNLVVKTWSDYVFRDEDFDTYSRRLHEFAFFYPEKAAEQHFEMCELVHIGTYDESTGIITVSPEQQIFDLRGDLATLDALRRQANGGAN